jgi:hypothetical protein
VTQSVDVASADPLPAADLAYARLLVGAELLAADFYSQAVAAANTGPRVAWYLRHARANENDHYASVAQILTGAGLTPAVATGSRRAASRGRLGGSRPVRPSTPRSS